MTTIKELAKTNGSTTADLAAKAGELGFKGGINAELPPEILDKINAVPNNGNGNSKGKNGNGKENLALSGDRQTIDLSNPDLGEELKIAAALGITKADLLLEAERQAFEQHYEAGQEEIDNYILGRYGEYREALTNLQAARPTQKRQSIAEKFAELQAKAQVKVEKK